MLPLVLPSLRMTDLDDPDGLQFFQRLLETSGILAALRDAGIEEGDTVSLYDWEFEYLP